MAVNLCNTPYVGKVENWRSAGIWFWVGKYDTQSRS